MQNYVDGTPTMVAGRGSFNLKILNECSEFYFDFLIYAYLNK